MPPKSSGKKPYKDPLKVQNTDDPIKARVPEPKPYVDPLRGNPTTLKLQPVKYEYKPYNSFHEFKPSNIDPLTGRPYRQRKHKQESEEPEAEKEEQPIKVSSCFSRVSDGYM